MTYRDEVYSLLDNRGPMTNAAIGRELPHISKRTIRNYSADWKRAHGMAQHRRKSEAKGGGWLFAPVLPSVYGGARNAEFFGKFGLANLQSILADGR